MVEELKEPQKKQSAREKNKPIIDIIQKIADYYKAEGDKGRILAYSKAAASLRSYD